MVQKAKRHFKNLNIKFKLILMLYVAILPFLFAIISYLYYTMRQGTENTVTNAYLEVARQINAGINFVQRDAQDISTYLCINKTVNAALKEETDSYGALNSIWANDSSMDFFKDIIATKSYLSYIALYANNGKQPYCITTDTSLLKNDIDEIMKTDCYKRADAAKGAAVWQRFEKNDHILFEINKSPKVAMTRVIRDSMRNTSIGYLMLGINSSYFEDICRNSIVSSDEGVIVVKDGIILLETGVVPDEVRTAMETGQIKGALDNHISSKINLDKYIIFYSCQDTAMSEVYYVIPRAFLLKNVRDSVMVSAALIIGVLLLLLPIALAFSNSIAKPLHALCDSMKKFKKGDFSQYVEYEAGDEIGEVTRGYNDMVHNIGELIDTTYILKLRERESELNTLQAQINPHFLYNTLDSIYWKALADGNDDTAEMVYSLSRIFRLSLNRGQGMTTVEKEIELVEHYLSIQKKRFNEKLDYSIDVDDSIRQYIMPKLVLQPFVENAIVHGIEQEGKGGSVSVLARKEENRLYFVINDSGKGMSAEQIKRLFNREAGEVNTSKTPGGYAISNVYERLKLRYKDEFELLIESREMEGTKITISIPYNTFLDGDME